MASGLMTKQAAWLAGVLAMLVLGFTFAGEPRAQTQTTQVAVRNFEIIAVDGNHLILRDERGTSDYFVPADFEFTVDGKKMTVADLKAGMKGQATVTTTTTITPVTVTERPHALGADDIAPLRAVGMADEEIIDLLHAVAIFGWANRLMQNLGEPADTTT